MRNGKWDDRKRKWVSTIAEQTFCDRFLHQNFLKQEAFPRPPWLFQTDIKARHCENSSRCVWKDVDTEVALNLIQLEKRTTF